MSEWLTDFAARLRQDRERARAHRLAINEAIAAVRSVSAGKSKDEVRELLAAELRTRDITPPAEPILSHMADRVLADDDALTRLRLAGRGLGILADLGAKVTRDIKEQFQAGGLNMDLGSAEPLFIHFDRSRPGAPVVLDQDAQHWFDANTDSASRPDFSEIFVVLSWARLERESGQVAVRAGDRRVGAPTAADSEDFRSTVDQGSQQDRLVVTEAALERTPDAHLAPDRLPAQHQRMRRARHVPDEAANQGDSRSLTGAPTPQPTWNLAGSASAPDDLEGSRSRLGILAI